jgi:serine/threonine protein kinase
MKFCPQCNQVFADDQNNLVVCQGCGTELVSLEEEQSLVGKTIKNEITIKELIGQGGMGTVFRAYQHSMERDIAVKVLRKSYANDIVAVKRFFKEARAVSRLKNSHTIVVHDFGQTDNGFLYITMELLLGKPLSGIIHDQGSLTFKRAAGIVSQVCQSLSEAHLVGIIHRDLKPDNIFIIPQTDGSEFIKVLDFGIAKILGSKSTALTGTGYVCGTPLYMSPEHAVGNELSHKSDIYSLGIIFYEMLTGSPPFIADTPMGILYKHVHELHLPLSESLPGLKFPAGLPELLDAMLAKEPDNRPASFIEIQRKISEINFDTGDITGAGLRKSGKNTQVRQIPHENFLDSSIARHPGKQTETSTSSWKELGGSRIRRIALFASGIFVFALGIYFYFILSESEQKSLHEVSGQSEKDARQEQTTNMSENQPLSIKSEVKKISEVPVDNNNKAVSEIITEKKSVEIRISSIPEGSDILRNGKVIAKTPYTLKEKQSDQKINLEIQKKGYQTQMLEVSFMENAEHKINLVKTEKKGNVLERLK